MSRALPYALALGLFGLFHVVLLALGATTLSAGDLAGPDSYMRLVRVSELYDTGAWFDITVERSNAPYGHTLHWTRPYDVILLAGAWSLSYRMPFEAALFCWGGLTSPLFHLCLGLALVWATEPMFDLWRRCLAVLALLPQLAVLGYAMAGRADHHMLIILIFTLNLGAVLRVLQHPASPGRALLSGALVGLGLWLSPEALIMAITVYATVCVLWVLRGGELARSGLWLSLGVLITTTLALFIERSPSDLLLAELDRLSIVQWTAAALALAFWSAAVRAEGRAGPRGVARRAAVLAVGSLAVGAVLYLLFPALFLGVHGMVDPRLDDLQLDIVAENQPLLPVDMASLGRFSLYLGAAVICLPFLLYLIYREAGRATWEAWVCVGLGLLVSLPLGLLMARFAPFGEILLVIVLTELLARLLKRIERLQVAAIRVVLWASTLVLVPLGPVWLSPLVLQSPGPAAARLCDWPAIAAYLNDPQGLGDRPRILLTEVDAGPELLYRTDHGVVGTPYHRNLQGLLDNERLFGQTYDQADPSLFETRGIDLILLCGTGESNQGRAPETSSFHDALMAGRHPEWLRPVGLPDHLDREFRLYQLLR